MVRRARARPCFSSSEFRRQLHSRKPDGAAGGGETRGLGRASVSGVPEGCAQLLREATARAERRVVSRRQALASPPARTGLGGCPNEEAPRLSPGVQRPTRLSGSRQGVGFVPRTIPRRIPCAFSNNQRGRRRLRPGTARRPPGAGEERPPVGAPRNVPVGGSCSRPGGQARGPGGGHFLERTASGGCERRCRRRPTLGPSQPATSGPHRPPPASAAPVLPSPPPRRAPRTVRPLALPGLARPGAAAR